MPGCVDNPATTCVRAAYKAKQMGIRFVLGDLDPTIGTLAATQKAKFDEITKWVDNPLVEYCAKAKKVILCS